MLRTLKLTTALLLLAGMSNVHADVTFDLSESQNCFPFGGCGPDIRTTDYQQFYSRAAFGTTPLQISGISFKPGQDIAGAFGTTPVNLILTLSTTLAQAGEASAGDFANAPISESFSGNLGTNNVVVFSGTTTLSSSGNNIFDINIPFTTNYSYDPGAGNLLVGVNIISGMVPASFAAGESTQVSRYFDGNIEVGYGLATQFVSGIIVPGPDPASPVPETRPVVMLLAGLGLMSVMAIRRQQKPMSYQG